MLAGTRKNSANPRMLSSVSMVALLSSALMNRTTYVTDVNDALQIARPR